MGRYYIKMNFSGDVPELIMAEFGCHLSGMIRRVVRGKTSGAWRNMGTFQWTTAVRAVCVLMVREKLHGSFPEISEQISGKSNSLASSLDYAISKSPHWLIEMFGSDSLGESTAKRIFLRTNSNMKRPGPVTVGLNSRLLAAHDISIVCDEWTQVDDSRLLEMLGIWETVEITQRRKEKLDVELLEAAA